MAEKRDEEKTRGELIEEVLRLRREQQAAEERLRALLRAVENMQIGLTVTDTDGRIIYTNPSEARMHGYETSELIGRDVRVFAPEEHGRQMGVEVSPEVLENPGFDEAIRPEPGRGEGDEAR